MICEKCGEFSENIVSNYGGNFHCKKCGGTLHENSADETEKVSKMVDIRLNEPPKEVIKDSNLISNIVTITSWIVIIVGIIAGLAMASNKGKYEDEFSFSIAFTIWASSILTGIVLLGLAEVIKLLNSIKQKMK